MTKVAVETVDAVRRRLAVEVPAAAVRAETERAYDTLRRKANVRGFRPGRAPRPVLERLFGDRVRAEVLGKLIQESYEEALRTERIEPVGDPEVVTEQAEPNGPLRYSVTVEVKPDIVASGYTGLTAERRLRPPSDTEVDRALEDLRQSMAQLRPIQDRRVANAGDLATVDYEARTADRLVARAEGRLVEVGDQLPPTAFGAHLIGAEIGVPVEAAIDYSPDYDNEELAGQRVALHMVVKALWVKEVPPLDDEFAKDQGECETLGELRARVRRQLEATAAGEADKAVRATLVAQLLRAHEVEVPRSMVERRAELMVDEFLSGLGPRRPPASREPELRARLREQLAEPARDQVKAGLLLEAIARQEGLTIGEEEIEAQIERLAQRAGNARERVRALYQEPAARMRLRSQLLQERALDHVHARARVTTVAPISSVADGEGNG
jgi:trigger factor